MWPCKSCGHENPDDAIVCENGGALIDEIGDSRDNKETYYSMTKESKNY